MIEKELKFPVVRKYLTVQNEAKAIREKR